MVSDGRTLARDVFDAYVLIRRSESIS
ncbi:uncharacterized protein G2W53_027282 [Senna tora]|uniref:Uncharacterized protein n=1 Tax=Senna tora TaxID=362788 RepID=A0A834WGG4_9FABA|nr:uncharacterized protein G2W53_027282 [Senna tora]